MLQARTVLSGAILAALMIPIPCTAAALTVQHVDRLEDGLRAASGDGILRLQVYADGIIRVRYREQGMDAEPKVPAITARPVQMGWSVEHGGDTITLATPSLRAVLDRENGALRFFDAQGTELTAEVPESRTLGAATVEGVSTFQPRQAFVRRPGERYYGLGEFTYSDLNRPTGAVELRQQNTRSCIPVLASTRGYGIFWNNPSLTNIEWTPDSIAWSSEVGEEIDYVILAGEDLDAVIARYRALTGRAPMFPKWAYGLWFSRLKYSRQDEILNAALTFRERGIPVDILIQDFFYWPDKWGTHEFDPERYPDPAAMIERLHDRYHMKFMAVVWAKLHVDIEHGRQMDHIGALIARGKPGQKWDWGGQLLYYDPFDPRARELFWRQANTKLFTLGLDAWWLDASEPEIDDARWHAAETEMGKGARVFNAYPLMHTTTFYDGQRGTDTDKRVVLLTRSAWAGQQRNGAVSWSGDIHGDWRTFKQQIEAGQNFCSAGIPYWTTDIGGFFAPYQDEAYRELFIRWFQWGAFCPIFRIHGSGQPHPWEMGRDVERNVIKYARLRYRLLPYIYSVAGAATHDHATIMRPLAADFAEDPQTKQTMQEFLFGPAILAAPVTKSQKATGEVIPAGALIDAEGNAGALTGAYYTGTDFEQLALKRRDEKIDFNWQGGNAAPAQGMPAERFSVRWTGKFRTRAAGEYQFITRGDDGVRLWVDGKLLIDDWNVHPPQTQRGNIELAADATCDIKLEFFENTGEAVIELSWKTPGMQPPPKTWDVYLPSGCDWYDFWTGQRFAGGETYTAPAPLDTMPLFVRAGAIIPMGPELQYVGQKPADPIELRVYPGADARFTLYEDEGDGFGYENGACSRIPMAWDEDEQVLMIGRRQGSFPGMLTERKFRVVFPDEEHGVGIAPAADADADVRYTGRAVRVQQTD